MKNIRGKALESGQDRERRKRLGREGNFRQGSTEVPEANGKVKEWRGGARSTGERRTPYMITAGG